MASSIASSKNIDNYYFAITPSKGKLQFLLDEIRTFPTVMSGYKYEGEGGINPAYCDIDTCEMLCPNETRIWALRSDGILATGVKNVCVSEGNTDLFQKVDGIAKRYLDKKNRYGHPSLCVPEGDYDGSVHYAGWLCQRADHLQVFLQSGRFRTETILTATQRDALEAYIAYKFLKTYQQQTVIFYDRIGEELLTEFLSGPFSKKRPCRIYTEEIIEQRLHHFERVAYEKLMVVALTNMRLSVEKLIKEHNFLMLTHLMVSSELMELGAEIKNCFDLVMYSAMTQEQESALKQRLKEVICRLVATGIPFVHGKSIVIWSTKLARSRAETYALCYNAVTDGIAQDVLRKILLGWPDGQLNVLFHAVKNPSPLHPKLSKLFWSAMSEVFMEELREHADVHIFFQDSLTIGNFCWDCELQVARTKSAQIHLHCYDLQSHSWQPPILWRDPSEVMHIPIKRRYVHPLDRYTISQVEFIEGRAIWNQEFKEGSLEGEIVSWPSPKILTLGKLQAIAKKMIAKIPSRAVLPKH